MKTIIICPNQASGVAALADSKPAAILPFLGESFLSYWMEHLALRNVTAVRLVTTDDLEKIEEVTGDGSRWGLNIELFHEVRDLSTKEARMRYRPAEEAGWAESPDDVVEIDHVPGMPEIRPFESYASWFEALRQWLPHVTASKRIGLREVQPGVWAGRRTRIARSAKIEGPCWLGDQASVGNNAIIGPNTFIEDQAVLDDACEVRNSWIGPDTFVGSLTRVQDSLAWGRTLINWRTGSSTTVPDSFLMCSLAKPSVRRKRAERKAATQVVSPLSRPLEAVISLAQKIQS